MILRLAPCLQPQIRHAITDEELMKLDRLANQHNIPLVIDNALRCTVSGIIFSEARPLWNPNIILCMSLLEAGAARFPLRDYFTPMIRRFPPLPT